ncbi:MAG: BCD family MFS transporter [Thermodesulfobacteriota bacterium]
MIINPLVLKLGMVRFATSFLVVLLVNVLNRVLVVDLLVPTALVTFSFAFQHVMTPVGLATGYLSDAYPLWSRYRAPYIWGGMLLSLAVMPFFPGWAEALGAAPENRWLLYEGVLLFSLFGIGTTVSATAINALLVDRFPEPERGSALTLVWIMTLVGFIAGSILISLLFPENNSPALARMFGLVTVMVLAITVWGAWGVEPKGGVNHLPRERHLQLWPTLKFLGSNGQTLTFFLFLASTIFFLAIQTFILTPFGGQVLSLPVGQTSKFGVYTTYGVLLGMVGMQFWLGRQSRLGEKAVLALSLVGGGLAFILLSWTAFKASPVWGIYALWLLGLTRGLYNVGLSHLTMRLAHPALSGVFMGLWNLVSGLALAGGEMLGGFLKDFLFQILGDLPRAYGWVFLLEGVGFLCCLLLLLPLKQEKYRPALAAMLARQTGPANLPVHGAAGLKAYDDPR